MNVAGANTDTQRTVAIAGVQEVNVAGANTVTLRELLPLQEYRR